MPKFKIETLDINFEYQEKLLKSVEQGIKETKRKLNDTEIMITLEPNKSDAQEWQRWEKALDNVIHRPTNLNFPNLSRMKKEHEMKKLSQLEATRRSKMASRDAAALQAQRVMAKQAQNMQKKIIEGKCKFGSSIEGEQIGVVSHYKGTNTYEVSGKRVLRRKDGRNHMVDPENPDLPPWIGPMYYFDAQESHLEQSKKSARYFQLPFESKREKQRSSAIIERENITRRRHELRSAAVEHREHHGDAHIEDDGHYHSTLNGGSSRTFHRTFADVKASIEREDRGEEDPDWEEVYSPSRDDHSLSSRKSSSRRLLKDDSAVFSAVGGSTNQSSYVTPAESLQPSAINTARQPSLHVTYSQQLVDDNILSGTTSPPRNGTAIASAKPAPAALTSSASVGSFATSLASSSTATTKRSDARSKSIGMDPHLAQQRHRVVLDPLLTHHAYALKILQSDPSVQQAASYGQQATLNPHLQLYQQQRRLPNRCKDYTFHALTNQKPLVLDNFNIENSIASVAQRMQQQQQQQQQQQSTATTLSAATELNPSLSGPNSRTGTANASMGTSQLKYSSDIFKKPTVEYRTADELWKEAKVKFNASHLVPDPFGNVGGATTNTTATNGNGGGNSPNRNTRGSVSVPRRRRYDSITPILREGSEAAESMELTMQLLTSSRATTAHRSSRPYGMLASLDLFSASQQQPPGSFSPLSKPTSPEGGAGGAMGVAAPLSRGHTPLPRHMSPPRSSPLRETSNGNASETEFGDELPPMDDFPMSSAELLASTSPVGDLIDDFMTSHHVYRSHDFNAFSSKRRERKPLDTNRTGQMKSRYRSKARGMSPSKSASNGDDTWDAASVLQEIENMKGLLLEEDPAEVYPALIEANLDRDIDHIVLR